MCIVCNHEFIKNAFMAGASKKASEPKSDEPADGQPRRMGRHISTATQLDEHDDDDANQKPDEPSQAAPAQPDTKKPESTGEGKKEPKATAAKTRASKKPSRSRHMDKPTGASKREAVKKQAPKSKTNKEPGKKTTQKKPKVTEKEKGDEKDRQDRDALKVAEAKAAAHKPKQAQKKPSKADDEQEHSDEGSDAVQKALHRADTQEIKQKEAVRRAYKTRKERFYRSLKSVPLSFLLSSFALHMHELQAVASNFIF